MPSKSVLIAQAFSKTGVLSTVTDIDPSVKTGQIEVATSTDLPTTGNEAGDLAFVADTNRLYIWSGAGWYSITLVNEAPNITAVEDDSGGTTPFTLATDGGATVITITANDPEGIPLTYNYSVTSGSLTNGGGTTATITQSNNIFTVTPSTTENYAGTFSLTFTASDGINIATNANSFTLAFTPDWDYDADVLGTWSGAGQYYATAQNQIYKAGGMWINSDGTKLYISAQQNNGQLQVYSMSTPYLYSTLSHDYTGYTYINAYNGFDFTDDGMRIVYTRSGGHYPYYNNLNNAFDVSTRDGAHVTVTQMSPGLDVIDFKFSYDGTKAFLLCGDSGTNHVVRTWDLSTAYDVSTASEDTSNQINFYTKNANNARQVSCIQFNPLGTVLYFIAEYNHTFCSYPLSTPWDVSTAGTLSADGPLGVSNLFRFTTRKDDGSTVFLMGDANYNVARIYHKTLT